MDCYNCGYDGNGIILNYGLYKMLSERYSPKVIIYEITSAFDLLKGDNKRFLKVMRPFYDRTGIDSIFFNVDETERFKNISRMYRYNSFFTQVFRDYLAPKNKNITMAMAALGAETSIDKFKKAGAKPFILAFVLYAWLLVGGWALARYVAPLCL